MMRIRWFGHSAFQITADSSVFIDPFGEMGEGLAARGLEFR
jgi:L-ascorbate metabolism protein UlaG (beta-lactamase superfamily)